MLCNRCNQNEAVSHIKTSMNGQVSEQYLCADCLQELQAQALQNMYSEMQDNNSFWSMPFSMLQGFESQADADAAASAVKRCPTCGSSMRDIIASGKVGCADCYATFHDELMNTVGIVNKQIGHIGKVSKSADVRLRQRSALKQLEGELQEAIHSQAYEQAAVLRDRIQALKAEGELK